MAHKNAYEHLAASWKDSWNTNYTVAPLAYHLSRISEAAQTVSAVRGEHVAAGKLTKAGILEKVREAAAGEAVPTLRRAYHAVEGAKASIAARRAELAAVKIDKTDIVGAMVRQEIRAKLATMDEPSRMALLLGSDDPRVWDAYRELPTFSPLPADFAQRLEDQRLEQAHPEVMEGLREAVEAVTVVETMLGAAIDEVRSEADFPKTGPEFDTFMTAASAAVDAEFTKPEPVKVDVNGLWEVISKLSHKDRSELIDKSLGRQMETLVR